METEQDQDTEIIKIMADRLQRFIPDRDNAEGMAEALRKDLENAGYCIVSDSEIDGG